MRNSRGINILLLTLAVCLVFAYSGAVLAQGQLPSAAEAGITKFNEAPMLKKLVEKGELPPVEERLPADPVVVNPVEEIGQYGGTWNRVHNGEGMGWWKMINYVEPLVRWNREASDFEPNLARSWEWNEDATELTVHLVAGIKWSDGHPLTVDDFLFWWEDLVLDDTFPHSTPVGTRVNGEPMKVTKIDDYTLKFKFAAPNPLFLGYMARGFYSSSWYIVPSHYLKQYHPKYNPELSKEDTAELIDRYDNRHQYPDMPTYTAWKTVEFETGKKAVFERNPYYWKVDPKGNQLPYIDQVVSYRINDPEMLVLKTLEGSIDAQFRQYQLRDIPLLVEKSEEAGYRVILWDSGQFAWPLIMFGFNYPEKEIRDVLWNKKFRQALSYAIDRERINDLVFLGLGNPRQASLSRRTPVFQTPEGRKVYQEWAKAYADHNPEKAKQLLDEIGMVDRNGDGFRERPDGKEFKLIVTTYTGDPMTIDALDFVKQDWQKIGVNTMINPVSGTALNTQYLAGKLMVFGRGGSAAWDLLSAPAHWAPIEYTGYGLAPQAGRYFQTGGKQGIKLPEGSMLEQLQELYAEAVRTVDPEKRNQVLLRAYRLHIDEGPIMIGVNADQPQAVVVKNNFRNVPEFGIPGPWDLGYPGTTNPEQYFIKQ